MPEPESLEEARLADLEHRRLSELRRVTKQQTQLDQKTLLLVTQLRLRHRLPWATIAQQLGVTTQAAHAKYASKVVGK